MKEKEDLFQEVEDKVYAELLELNGLCNDLCGRQVAYQGPRRDWHKVLRERFGESIYKTLAVKFYGFWLLYGWDAVKDMVGEEYLEASRKRISSIASAIGG